MSGVEYIEVMWAEQHPDVYDGPRCDQIRHDWHLGEIGGKDGMTGGNDVIELKADTFPPGTKVVISVPLCPGCGDSADLGHHAGKGVCDCGFDWNEWARDEYA